MCRRPLGTTCGRAGSRGRRALPAQLCSLGVDDLVDRELFDVRWPLHLHPGGGDPWLDPAFKEGIEICPRLPEVDDSPATIDRTGRVKQHPWRRRAIRIDLIVRSVELF